MRKHGGPCLAKKNVCYKCGQEGHRKKDCPRNRVALPASEVTYFRCGQKGHTTNMCTQLTNICTHPPQNRGQQVNQRPPAVKRPGAPILAVPVAQHPLPVEKQV